MKSKPRNQPSKLTEEEKTDIIAYYTSMKDNRIALIAERFGVTKGIVHGVIDKYFAKK